MGTPARTKEASLAKRQRVCVICGAGFVVSSADRKGVACSKACLSAVMSNNARIRVHSPETIAKRAASMKRIWANPERAQQIKDAHAAARKIWHADPNNAAAFAARASARMKAMHADPEWQKVRDARSSRVMKANWANNRDAFTRQATERYESGLGINSADSKQKKAVACKWIMRHAQQALHTETEYNQIYAVEQERLRREFPYDGIDYIAYCSMIGTMTVNAPACRALADSFLSGAIPRFAKEWQGRKFRSTGAN